MRFDKSCSHMILLAIAVQVTSLEVPSIGHVWNLVKFGQAVSTKIKSGHDAYQALKNNQSQRIDKIMAEAAEVTQALDGIESRLSQKIDIMIETLVSRISVVQKLNATFLELHKIIVRIDGIYNNFVEHAQNRTEFNNVTIQSFINTTTGLQPNGLQELLNQMHELMVPCRTANLRGSLFLNISQNHRETRQSVCDEGISPHEAIFQIYSTLALTELRGFVMAAYAYGLLPLFKPGKYNDEIDKIESKFGLRSQEYLTAAKEAMAVAPKTIHRCDPKGGHVENKTYVQFTGVYQSYIVNEADIHPHDSCRQTCDTMPTTYLRHKYDDGHCKYQKGCYGKVTDCQYAGGRISICEMPMNSSRRYQWFRTSDGTTYGDAEDCSGEIVQTGGWQRGFYRCDYCMCNCINEDTTDRAMVAISIMGSEADIKSNMVVTGARLVRHMNMLHIQVREGKLGPHGSIEEKSERWVPLPKMKWTKNRNYGNYILVKDSKEERMKIGKHYEIITYERRLVNLDEIIASEDTLVIGVRFRRADTNKHGGIQPIQLEIETIRYDYETGSLNTTRGPSPWLNFATLNKSKGRPQKHPRSLFKFNRPDNPLKSRTNMTTVAPYFTIQFERTDLKKDAGQALVPFWDIQDVVTIPSFALQGVGLYFRGHGDGTDGGFLGLRLHTLNFTEYLNTTLPDEVQGRMKKIYTELLYTPQLVGKAKEKI